MRTSENDKVKMDVKKVSDYAIPDKLNYFNCESGGGMKEGIKQKLSEGEIIICQQHCQENSAFCQHGEERTGINLIAFKPSYFSGILDQVTNLLERLLDA